MKPENERPDENWTVCGVTCPTCRLGCNQERGHSGSHTDREHSW